LLAVKILESDKLKEPALVSDYSTVAKLEWWRNNVTPTYLIPGVDAKAPFQIRKEQRDAGDGIVMNFVFAAKNKSPEVVVHRLGFAAAFLQQGGTYLAIKDINSVYIGEIESDSKISGQVTQNQIELGYLKERARILEGVKIRFPQHREVSGQQIVEVNDSNAKYLPIESQLIAVYADIQKIEEDLVRLRAQLARHDIMRKFLQAMQPLLSEELNGLQLLEKAFGTEADLRRKVDRSSHEELFVLDRIKDDLKSVHLRYVSGLKPNSATKPVKLVGPAKSGIIGFVLAAFLAVILLKFHQGWIRYRIEP